MKVAVTQQNLAHGLSIVSRAVSPRSTLPVLLNVLLATDEGRLRLSATNLELGITCWVPATIEEEGSTTVPARTFVDLVTALPGETVNLSLTTRTQTLNVRCGASVTDIKGIDSQEFPPIPVPELTEGIALNVSDFKEMIQQVAFCAATEEARPQLQGVLMKVNAADISLAATDGFRISVRKATLSAPVKETLQIIIPARALTELGRIITDGDQVVTMVVPSGRAQVIFHLKDIELASQLIDGNFPDYNAIVPRSFKTNTIINTSQLLKACKQSEIIARESNNVVRFNLVPGGEEVGLIELSAQDEQTGNSEIKVDVTIDGVGLAIAFNVRFLREVLEVIKAPTIALQTNANNTPAMITPVGDDQFLHVIMPMNMN